MGEAGRPSRARTSVGLSPPVFAARSCPANPIEGGVSSPTPTWSLLPQIITRWPLKAGGSASAVQCMLLQVPCSAKTGGCARDQMNDTFGPGSRGPARQGGSSGGICTPSDHKNPVSKAFRVVSRPLTGSLAWKAAMHLSHMCSKTGSRSAGTRLPIPPARLHYPPQAYGMR